MTDEQKRQMIKLINGLPDYLDPAWADDPDGCKLDVHHAKIKLLEIVNPSNALDGIIENALVLADRRKYLCKNAPECASCNCQSKNVQLINYYAAPAEWKCRECRLPFLYEPKANE